MLMYQKKWFVTTVFLVVFGAIVLYAATETDAQTSTPTATDATFNAVIDTLLAPTLTSLAATQEARSSPTLFYSTSQVETAMAARLQTLIARSPTPTNTITFTPTQSPIPGFVRKDSKEIVQVWVPAGCFQMGSDPTKDTNAQINEQPAHQVCLTHGYWLDQFSVTNDAYQEFIVDGGYMNSQYWSQDGWVWKNSMKITGPDDSYGNGFAAPLQPRIGVSWYEADAYARWRGCRLPTEAEWEYAARGPNSSIYPWGDVYDQSKLNATTGGTVLVNTYPQGQSWIGAFNMVGNVQEWTVDIYDQHYYDQKVGTDPQNTSTAGDGTRVLRGGGWSEQPLVSQRAAYRNDNDLWFRDNETGFRVVCDN
ncbi:MAG: formylglycine-generating enzyme family protein [Aggregatilineales bacterium]